MKPDADGVLFLALMGGTLLLAAAALLALIYIGTAAGADPAVVWAAGAIVAFCTGGLFAED